MTWTPTADQTGAQAVTIEARDGKGGITPQSFSVTVSATPPTNRRRRSRRRRSRRRRWAQPYSYQATATDLDNDPLRFVRIEGPTGLTVAETGLVAVDAAAGRRRTRDDRGAGRPGRHGASSLTASRSATRRRPTSRRRSMRGPTWRSRCPPRRTLSAPCTTTRSPPGKSLTASWSKLSGPGTVTFSVPGGARTQATFSLARPLYLQLSGSDGELSATDTVVVTVNAQPTPSNTPPTVTITALAGPVTLPASAALLAQAQDDGLPNPPAALSLIWTKSQGPGERGVRGGDAGADHRLVRPARHLRTEAHGQRWRTVPFGHDVGDGRLRPCRPTPRRPWMRARHRRVRPAADRAGGSGDRRRPRDRLTVDRLDASERPGRRRVRQRLCRADDGDLRCAGSPRPAVGGQRRRVRHHRRGVGARGRARPTPRPTAPHRSSPSRCRRRPYPARTWT